MHVRHTEDEEQDDDDDSEEQHSEDEGPRFEEYEAVDGDTAYDVGLMYANVVELSALYNQLCCNSHDWEGVYRGGVQAQALTQAKAKASLCRRQWIEILHENP
ncbi:hypothetical protein CC79DRAFT_1374150 [Sarocladium strictum]